MRGILARVRAVRCNECSRPIRWWNHRVNLADGERYAHLACWNGHLFLNALVADEIKRLRSLSEETRRSQLVRDETPPAPIILQAAYIDSADNDAEPHSTDGVPGEQVELSEGPTPQTEDQDGPMYVAQPHSTGGVPGEQVELFEGPTPQTEDQDAPIYVDANKRSRNSSQNALPQHLRHFFSRSVFTLSFELKRLIQRRPPRPQSICILCGAIAFSDTSGFCTKCGGSFRPESVSGSTSSKTSHYATRPLRSYIRRK
jgi:hypothetical protein